MQNVLSRVLVVDDEPQVCQLVREELMDGGFECHVASDAEQALQFAQSGQYGLMIVDIRMPGTSGLELLSQVKKACPNCKVILVSGYFCHEYLAQALVLGAYDYVQKPFKMGEITELTRTAFSGKSDLPQLASRAATAMQLSHQARQVSLDSIRALVQTVEAKDPYTRRHSEQVMYYATEIAKSMGMPRPALETLRVAAILHDIGKIGVPDKILTKPGQLTEEEFVHIRRHPALGSDILANISLFATEAKLVRHHHENYNGTGYPDGLAGEEIPLGSRILLTADSIDAMLMERTYKKGYPVEKMLDQLIRCAGTQFDPQIASAAVQWVRMNPTRLILPGNSEAAWQQLQASQGQPWAN